MVAKRAEGWELATVGLLGEAGWETGHHVLQIEAARGAAAWDGVVRWEVAVAVRIGLRGCDMRRIKDVGVNQVELEIV